MSYPWCDFVILPPEADCPVYDSWRIFLWESRKHSGLESDREKDGLWRTVMLLIFKDLKKVLSFLVSVIARLDRAIQRKELDYPVKPDNDKHWNRVRYA